MFLVFLQGKDLLKYPAKFPGEKQEHPRKIRNIHKTSETHPGKTKISRNFLEVSRKFLEISKKFLEISRKILDPASSSGH